MPVPQRLESSPTRVRLAARGGERFRDWPPWSTACVTCSAPDRRQPRLLRARQARRPIVVRKLGESGRGHMAPPGFETVVRAEATTIPAFIVVAARIGAEQHALRLERGTQFAQYAWQLLRRDMKQ